MQVKYIGEVPFNSKGIRYVSGGVHNIPEEIAEYLMKTFVGKFEVVGEEVKAPEPEAEPKVEEEKPKPTRKKRTKKAVPTEE